MEQAGQLAQSLTFIQSFNWQHVYAAKPKHSSVMQKFNPPTNEAVKKKTINKLGGLHLRNSPVLHYLKGQSYQMQFVCQSPAKWYSNVIDTLCVEQIILSPVSGDAETQVQITVIWNINSTRIYPIFFFFCDCPWLCSSSAISFLLFFSFTPSRTNRWEATFSWQRWIRGVEHKLDGLMCVCVCVRVKSEGCIVSVALKICDIYVVRCELFFS